MERFDKERKVNMEDKDKEFSFMGVRHPNPVKCRTCMNSNGEPPFEDSPEKSYCMVFRRKDGNKKPKEVLWEGKDCKYYKEASQK